MDDEAHVGLVDAHSEGVGGHHHAHIAALPLLLSLVAHAVVEAGVVVGSDGWVLGVG